MKKHLFGVALMLSALLISGMASAQFTDIDDIQVYDALRAPASPLDGTTVTVAGNIYVVKGTYNNGTHYIADATGGVSFFDSGATLSMGDYVEITGTVGTYTGEIQLTGLTYANAAAGSEPAPIEVTAAQCLVDGENVGSFVSVIGTIVNYSGGSTFSLAGAAGMAAALQRAVDQRDEDTAAVTAVRADTSLQAGDPVALIGFPLGLDLPIDDLVRPMIYLVAATTAVSVSPGRPPPPSANNTTGRC